MALQFSATRFKQPHARVSDAELEVTPQLKTAKSTPHSLLSTLLSTPNYALHKLNRQFPPFQANETLLNYSVTPHGVAVASTNKRVLLYDIRASSSTSYPIEFNLDSIMGESPLANLIPNPSIDSKPHLAILDPLTGTLKFIESLNFIPSLTVVQNESLIDLPLHSNEIITSTQYEQHIGLLVATSQKRVILVSFFDSLGNINISCSQIFSDRSIFNYIMSKDLTTKKSITALEVFSESPVTKKVFILESNNTLIILNHIISSGIFSSVAKLDLNDVLDTNGLSAIQNFKISSNGQSLILLAKSTIGSFFIVEINLSSLSVESSFEVHSTINFQSGEIYLIEDKNVMLLELVDYSNVPKLIIVDLLNKINMDQIIGFKPTLKIFSISPPSDDKVFTICTNDGILTLDYYSTPNQSDVIQSITSRIEQYLLFNYEDSPISYNIFDSGIEINQSQIELAIEGIMSNILNNKLLKSNLNNIEIPIENLLKRINLLKNFVVFISQNYKISQRVFESLLESSSMLSLSYHFLDSIQNRDIVDKVMPLIKNSTSKSIGHHIINNCGSIVELISDFIDSSLPLGNERQIVELSSLLNDTFSEGYVGIDLYIKSILNIKGLGSPIFVRHFNLLENINLITSQLFSVAVKTDKMDGMNSISDTVNDSIFGLSLILYYSINDCIVYEISNSQPAQKFQTFLKSNKQNWIQSFCVLNRQDDILQSADDYEDMDSLSVLIDSQREEIDEQEAYQRDIAESKGDILFEINNDILDKQRKVELLFDHYFTKYGYQFASSLFNYYVSKGKINHLLSNFNEEKYIHYLDQFMNDNYDNGYYKFGWIKDIKSGLYTETSQKLIYHVEKFDDSLTNKQLMLSIAKLSAIADVGEGYANVNNQSLIDTSNTKLKTLDIQVKIQNVFEGVLMRKNSDGQSITELVKFNNKFIEDINIVISSFESKMEVPLLQLVNVVTLLLLQKDFINEQTFDEVTGYLVELLELTEDPQVSEVGNKILWRRIILWNDKEISSDSVDLMSIKFIQYIVKYKDEVKLAIPKSMIQLKMENLPDFDEESAHLEILLSNWDAFDALGEF